jgi:hypothetical protein
VDAVTDHSDQDFLVFTQSGPAPDLWHNVKGRLKPAASVGSIVIVYAFLRLAMPTNPSRPEPNSQAAVGTGTTQTSTARTAPLLKWTL